MERRKLPDAADIRAALDYDPRTGRFTWRWRDDVGAAWNARWAGEQAGSVNTDGYVVIRIHRHSYYAHHIAWLLVHGVWPDRLDHRNGRPGDNRIRNLREATQAQNALNRGAQANGSSGFKGVSLTRTGRWRAYITVAGSTRWLGTFDTPEDAARAYRRAAKQLHGAFARAK